MRNNGGEGIEGRTSERRDPPPLPLPLCPLFNFRLVNLTLTNHWGDACLVASGSRNNRPIRTPLFVSVEYLSVRHPFERGTVATRRTRSPTSSHPLLGPFVPSPWVQTVSVRSKKVLPKNNVINVQTEKLVGQNSLVSYHIK